MNSPDAPLSFESIDLFKGLGPATLDTLRRIARVVERHAGELILAEGEVSGEVYLVESGRLLIFRAAHEGLPERRVVELGPGEVVGELALIDGGPRSMSVRAESDCRLVVIDPQELVALPGGEAMVAELKGGFGVAVARRVREHTNAYIGALEREIEAGHTQQRFGQFFIYILGVMTIGTLINNAIARHLVVVDVYTQQFAWQYMLIILIPSTVVIRYMKIPLRQLGLSREGMRKSLTEGGVVSLVAVALTALLAGGLYLFGHLPGRPLQFELVGTLTYLIHSFLQELLSRGFLQSSFQRFLNDTRGLKSVGLSAVLFGLFHLHFGMSAVVLTIVSSLLFGAFYLRHQNLAGVTLLHFTTGVCAFSSGLI